MMRLVDTPAPGGEEVGLKFTLMLQEALAARLEPQSSVSAKPSDEQSDPSVFPNPIERSSAVLPVLVTVTICGGLVLSTGWLAGALPGSGNCND